MKFFLIKKLTKIQKFYLARLNVSFFSFHNIKIFKNVS